MEAIRAGRSHLVGQRGLELIYLILLRNDLVADVGNLRLQVGFGCFQKTRGRISQAIERVGSGFEDAAGTGGSEE
jgi:hypothetical protein